MGKKSIPYRGITYPKRYDNKIKQAKWRKKNCPKEIHLFDEVKGAGHYLYCDACGLTVHIAGFEDAK